MLNIYACNYDIVSPLGRTKDGKMAVINRKGEKSIVAEADLTPTSLTRDGIYHEKFIQAAIGGLKEPVRQTKGITTFIGQEMTVFAAEVHNGLYKMAIGIPHAAFPVNAPDTKPHGYDDDPKKDQILPKDGRADNGKGGANTKSPMEDINDLEAMGDTTPQALELDDGTQLSQVKEVIIKWKDNPQINGSISDIKVS